MYISYLCSATSVFVVCGKSRGLCRVQDFSYSSMNDKVTLNSGHMIRYHSYERWDEVWTV